MPNLTGIVASGHMAGRVGYALTAGLAAGGSTSIADLSAGRGDTLISVLVVKGGYISATAGFAAGASAGIGGNQISGGISAGRNDTVDSVVTYGTAGTLSNVSSGSVSVSVNRMVIVDHASSNRHVQARWNVGNFAGRKVPAGSVAISATRIKVTDIATNGHMLQVNWWKGDQA